MPESSDHVIHAQAMFRVLLYLQTLYIAFSAKMVKRLLVQVAKTIHAHRACGLNAVRKLLSTRS